MTSSVALVQELASRAQESVSVADLERVSLLLADAFACCLANRASVPAQPFVDDGPAGSVALLALRISARDLDDVDWTSLHHPGSVILPVVIALGGPERVPMLARAIASGYRVAATMADLLGIEHRRRWHVTATAGAIGAASAASVMLGATAEQHAAALALAAANVGGIGQGALERTGAASFNRAAGASLGLLAARSAIAGALPTRDWLNGPRGLLELTSAADLREPVIRDGIRDAAPRIFPVTGFAQSAVLATAMLRAQATGPLEALEVAVTPIAETMGDGSAGGDWWNLRLAVARAWELGDALRVDDTSAGAVVIDLVTITSAPLPSGACEVIATVAGEQVSSGIVYAPSLDPSAPELLVAKWTTVLEQDATAVLAMSARFLQSGELDVDLLTR